MASIHEEDHVYLELLREGESVELFDSGPARSLHVTEGERIFIRANALMDYPVLEFSLRLQGWVPTYELWKQNHWDVGYRFRELRDSSADPDHDGFTNLEEMIFGTDPLRPPLWHQPFGGLSVENT